jgi:P4 family phage/plasmid primase-like protien
MDKNIKIEDLKNYSEIKNLLKMIGAIDDYGDWFKVSCIIKNTDERFYPLWVEWCKLSNQYNENVNDNIWAGLAVNGGLKMGSLHHIARSKNPDEYFKQNYFEIVDQWWDQDELGIANIYASLFNNELKCVSQKKGLFYVYNKKTCLWSLKNEGCLHATIAENMRPVFHRYIKFMKSSDNVSEKDMEKVKEITKVSLKLSKASFLKSVITILKGVEEIKDEDFQKILGSRLDILSVKNGVIDLRTGKLRKREFDDYLTEFINLEYSENDINEEWEHFINDVFDNKNIKDQKAVVDFLQVFLGYSITGNTNQQLFMINYGAGSNGKTVLTNIINAIFSNNVANVSSEILDKNVGGNNANSASPEIAKLFLKRLGIINESEDNMTLGANFKKLIDKNNEYPARPLYGDPFTFILMASFILNTNNLPGFPVIDDSFIRRLLTVPFLNKYKIKSEMRGDDKEIDRGLEDKILKNKNGVLCWFVKGSVKYYENNEKLPAIPDDLQAATSKYVDDNDFTKAFEFTNNERDFIPTTDIYQILNENYGIKITKKELKDAFEKRGAVSKKGFGYKKNVHGFRCLKSKFYQDEDLESDNDDE